MYIYIYISTKLNDIDDVERELPGYIDTLWQLAAPVRINIFRNLLWTLSKRDANYRLPISSCSPPRRPICRPSGIARSSPIFPRLAISI